MDAMERILKKIEVIEVTVNQIKVEQARHSAQEKNHQINIERFWQSQWPEAMEQIKNNSAKLVVLEMDLARLQTKFLIYGSLFFLIVPIVSMIVLEFLKSILNKGV